MAGLAESFWMLYVFKPTGVGSCKLRYTLSDGTQFSHSINLGLFKLCPKWSGAVAYCFPFFPTPLYLTFGLFAVYTSKTNGRDGMS